MILIKDFSKMCSFSIRMLRYLEEVELIVPMRGENNYRYYTEKQLKSALRIKQLQSLGFQLKEIKDLEDLNSKKHYSILKAVLARELEVAEIKSETIPRLKQLLSLLEQSQKTIFECLDQSAEGEKNNKKIKSFGGEGKFHRTAYNIPILKTIYEDYLAKEANITLVTTDVFKFSDYLASTEGELSVFSILKESSFSFGKNITSEFIAAYQRSWKFFFSDLEMNPMEGFSREDIAQLMGIHDVVIRTCFIYSDGQEGELTIPYSPVYAMTSLK